jgi:ATP-dependent DNA ligase
VRLCTRRGHDWTSPQQPPSSTPCSPDGVAVFDALKASDAILYAFDLLELDGTDLRPMLAHSNSG